MIGGGVIGAEFASIFASFGVQVTIVEMLDRLLPMMDADVSQEIAKSLKKQKVTSYVDSRANEIAQDGASLRVSVDTPDGPKVFKVDKVLVSVGRRANVEDLGLEAIGEPEVRNFECPRCDNRCQVNRIKVDQRVVHFGDACERYSERDRKRDRRPRPFPELFAARQELLEAQLPKEQQTGPGEPVGLLRGALNLEYLPLWVTFLRHLGYRHRLCGEQGDDAHPHVMQVGLGLRRGRNRVDRFGAELLIIRHFYIVRYIYNNVKKISGQRVPRGVGVVETDSGRQR